ncbi:hypothetical protein JCM8547_005905 [Rhodosporidiobolus lusitaniae]
MPHPGLSQRARAIVQELYDEQNKLPEGENLTKVIQERIKRETAEEYKRDQVNHVLRKLRNYQQRAGGHDSLATPEAARDVIYQGWLRYKHLPYREAGREIVEYARLNTNPSYTPTLDSVQSYMTRWQKAGNTQVSQAYPTPGILYFDHNLRILQPHEINHLSYNAEGHLVDAEGYLVTTQQL